MPRKAGSLSGMLSRRRSACLFLLACVFILPVCRSAEPADQVCFQRRCFRVEIVDDPESRRRGLQFRRDLADDAGMLFIFEEPGRHAFWMKETLISLDIIWMDISRRVVHVEYGVPPCRKDPCPLYAPPEKALYVLELPAGTARKIDLHRRPAVLRLQRYLKD